MMNPALFPLTLKAKLKKKIAQTDTIFDNLKKRRAERQNGKE